MNTSNAINEMLNELQNLANELDTVSAGITSDFQKVGNDTCVKVLTDVKSKLLDAKKTLT